MNDFVEGVKEFHKAFGVPINSEVQVAIPLERLLLRAKLIMEETMESIKAMGCIIDMYSVGGVVVDASDSDFKIDEIADGLADLIYVTIGAALEFGIPIEKVFAEVQRSNMTKFWTTQEMFDYRKTDDNYVFTASKIVSENHDWNERLYIATRPDGKKIKSPSYSPADIRKVLGL